MGVVFGIGELLWDIFPSGKFLGGAPVNFAYHCRQMGLEAFAVSRIGHDPLGRELLNDLHTKNLPTDFIQVDPKYPTGTVRVEMEGTNHRFIITEGVAWDYIEVEERVLKGVERAQAVCFGSLCQRNAKSRSTVLQLARTCPGLRVFDINLRQHFFSREIIEDSLKVSNVLKLNIDELILLQSMLELSKNKPADMAREILDRYHLKLVCVTRGAEGALLVGERDVVDHPGRAVPVVDTVGCGDAFTAAMVHGLIHQKPLDVIAADASRVGEFVAGQSGATPPWPKELVISTQ